MFGKQRHRFVTGESNTDAGAIIRATEVVPVYSCHPSQTWCLAHPRLGQLYCTSAVGVSAFSEVAMSEFVQGLMPSPGRRTLLHLAGAAAGAGALGGNMASAADRSASRDTQVGGLRPEMIGYMLPHEQFIVPALAKIGRHASQAGFDLLANSDHFQPWQAKEGHAAAAWVTMAATGAQAPKAWLGTTVTCPTFRVQPGRRCADIRVVEPSISGPRFPWCWIRRGSQRAGRHRGLAEMAGPLGSPYRGHRDYPGAMVRAESLAQGTVLHGRRQALRSSGTADTFAVRS